MAAGGKCSESDARPLEEGLREGLVAEGADPAADPRLGLVGTQGDHDVTVVFGLCLNLGDCAVAPWLDRRHLEVGHRLGNGGRDLGCGGGEVVLARPALKEESVLTNRSGLGATVAHPPDSMPASTSPKAVRCAPMLGPRTFPCSSAWSDGIHAARRHAPKAILAGQKGQGGSAHRRRTREGVHTRLCVLHRVAEIVNRRALAIGGDLRRRRTFGKGFSSKEGLDSGMKRTKHPRVNRVDPMPHREDAKSAKRTDREGNRQ